MRLLLDTHVLLWLWLEPERLRPDVIDAVTDAANDVLLSVASAWEISIKSELGKLTLPGPAARWLPAKLASSAIHVLPIEIDHALRAGALPPHHRDPFDRMLVAQAIEERMLLVTADEAIIPYGAPMLWAGRTAAAP
ncbi:MAG: type II toxin-antitoxin system VapC family toxin [Deltaproteobacteria bacterium]|nr:type II toxin-antitoxin system VapC family toxin [Deltaproteobacteria bacterium]MBP6829446.1 type II toxin-antitoxin system VapC family toxin [Deltaproteobacteria bacterium]